MPKTELRKISSIETLLKNEFDGMFRYIVVEIVGDQKKTPSDHKNYTPEQIARDRGDKINFTHYSIALKHTNIIVIDVDEYNYDYSKLPKIFNSLPYTE